MKLKIGDIVTLSDVNKHGPRDLLARIKEMQEGPIQHAPKSAVTKTFLSCGCVVSQSYAHLEPPIKGLPRGFTACLACNGAIASVPGSSVVRLGCQDHIRGWSEIPRDR